MNQRFTAEWDAVDPYDPVYPHLWVKAEHLGRYQWATNVLKELALHSVADVACGTGYGLRSIAPVATSITAVDIDTSRANKLIQQLAIKHSKTSFETIASDLDRENIVASAGTGRFDAILSFETLEHLVDPACVCQQFRELLRTGGYLLCSVPSAQYETTDQLGLPMNRNHKRKFRYSEFKSMLEECGFRVHYRLGQSLANHLAREEAVLIKRGIASRKLADNPSLHSAESIHHIARLTAYPSVDDVESSYSIILLAEAV